MVFSVALFVRLIRFFVSTISSELRPTMFENYSKSLILQYFEHPKDSYIFKMKIQTKKDRCRLGNIMAIPKIQAANLYLFEMITNTILW